MSTANFTQLPTYIDPYFGYRMSIEGQTRNFTFYWNERASCWEVDIVNADGVIVIQGMKLVPQYPILADYDLTSVGLTGYFCVLPSNDNQTGRLEDNPEALTQFFGLYYVTITE